MLSSVTPVFVDTGSRVLIGGSPGGSLIIGMSLLATLGFLDGQSAAAIVGAPRYHQQYLPDVVRYEPGAFSDDELKILAAQGDVLEPRRIAGEFSGRDLDRAAGKVEAASDPRARRRSGRVETGRHDHGSRKSGNCVSIDGRVGRRGDGRLRALVPGRPRGFALTRSFARVQPAHALTAYESRWMHVAGDLVRLDPTRMAQGIMTGIGFLGLA